MHKKLLSLLMVFCILFLCCSCKQQGDETQPKDNNSHTETKINVRDITLLYCQADTLNPYTCGTKYNQELCDLLYDPLIKLDENFTVQNCLADEVKSTASEVTVTLKAAKFSNGATLSADDVLYSFALAKNLPQYKDAFASVICSAESSKTLRFSLSAPDINFVHFLDFPIIQAKSDTIKNADNILMPPVGCGRYIYQYGQEKLTANADYHNGKVNIQNISLADAPDNVAANHFLEVGAIDYYYSDLSDDTIPKLNGKSYSVALNKLVYIGMNQTNALLADAQIRCTLSAALNRTALVNTAFHSDAVIAKSPFHPQWKAAEGYQYIEDEENIDVVLANLEETGYNSKDAEGYFVNKSGKRLSFSLLCPSSDTARVAVAEQLKTQLKKVGIALRVEVVPFAQFTERLAAGNFQLFLSEVQIAQNMDISSFATPGGSIAFGVTSADLTQSAPVSTEPVSKNLSQAIAEYKNQQTSIFDVVTIFNASMPVIPVCFRSGICIYASDFDTAPYTTISDVFYNIENATFK
ncbi:MAG: hypothetical protein IJW78_00420 [Clostridia bacterium]|nr:hypothetical protein [Clostridia bacterium]